MSHSCSCREAAPVSASRHLNQQLFGVFSDIARSFGAEIDPNRRIASFWYNDVFVAHSGLRSKERFDEGRPLSVIYIETPDSSPLAGLGDEPIRPGFYVARSFLKDSKGLPGDVELHDRSGKAVAKLIRDDNGSGACAQGPNHTCEDATNATVTYENCEICFYWDCSSLCHRYCIKIPFCDLVSGWVSTGDLVAKAAERQANPVPMGPAPYGPASYQAYAAPMGGGVGHPGYPPMAAVPYGFGPGAAGAPPFGFGHTGQATRGYSYCDRFGNMICVDIMPGNWPHYYVCGSCPMYA